MKYGVTMRPVLAAILALTCCSYTLAQGFPLPGDGGFPLPCGLECLPKAFEAVKACREGGGDFRACADAYAEALAACRAEAGCETPVRPPICGEECLKAAREAASACREAGGDTAACYGEVKAQLRACLDTAGCELPQPPEGPARCGLACLKDAFGVVRDCIKGGGSLRDCVGSFRETLQACREANDCSGGDEPPPDEEEEGVVLALALEQTFLRGDANADALVNITDPIVILDFLFVGSNAPGCLDAADANDDGALDIADPISLLFALFQGESAIPAPFPQAGFDPTEDTAICGVTAS